MLIMKPETTDSTILPGIKPVLDQLRQSPDRVDSVTIRKGRKNADTDAIVTLCRRHGIRFTFVQDTALDKLFSGNHQGVVARVFNAGYVEVEDVLEAALASPLKLVLALDQVQDPGNAGTLARTLYALGGGGIIMPKHNASALGSAAVKASAGALARLPVARATNLSRALETAADQGFSIYAARFDDGSVNAFTARLDTPAVLVLGNEDKGVRPGVAKRCTASIHIPMQREFDSLNVAQAGAMLMGCFYARLQS
ncbi:RNA methyltransferase, TrmH family, group 3 [Oleidesulfovibrio alaskensis G20]|jgi:23S rRNA (guanosine2251-2'-O)-methyltransferase|uniref:RNA methyltransferase, TrmH family, group 3 n=2 Tax=Oleidesulfovibrio alaskensis TaxID=58180 RepID=Q30VC2_OLEA2|nr:RNA methyltransferase, TrmH family, group 3 [Oleidesulfovibrio alaskensis G20]